MTPAKCPHAAAHHAASLPGVPCEECRAFVDSDGSLMTAEVARQRYPAYRTSFDEHEARWRPPKATGRILGASEQERRSNIKFLVWSAVVLAVIILVAGIAMFGSGTSRSSQEGDHKCPSFTAMANGECSSGQAAEQARHKEQVESEEHEAEGVIKQRKAEETANAVEEAAK